MNRKLSYDCACSLPLVTADPGLEKGERTESVSAGALAQLTKNVANPSGHTEKNRLYSAKLWNYTKPILAPLASIHSIHV